MSRFKPQLSESQKEELRRIAELLVAPGKGILAADEPADLLDRRFQEANLENTAETRRLYRQLLFTTPSASFTDHISGVILLDEAFYQMTDDGVRFSQLLQHRGILPGITVDEGFVPLNNKAAGSNVSVTQGLDGLAERCAKYKGDGAVFAKWRAHFVIEQHANLSHQRAAIEENCRSLARYATICQQNGLVPIVEPDISRSGSHDLATCQQITAQILSVLFKKLIDYGVYLEGIVLKPSMVTPGDKGGPIVPDEVAAATVLTMQRHVPAAVPGIGFLSGGMSETEATACLNAISKFGEKKRKTWATTFIFGRAIQNPVAKIWQGNKDNIPAAQEAFAKLIKDNGRASLGLIEL